MSNRSIMFTAGSVMSFFLVVRPLIEDLTKCRNKNNRKYAECCHESFREVTGLPSAHPENRVSNSARVRASTPILGATESPGCSVGDKAVGVWNLLRTSI